MGGRRRRGVYRGSGAVLAALKECVGGRRAVPLAAALALLPASQAAPALAARGPLQPPLYSRFPRPAEGYGRQRCEENLKWTHKNIEGLERFLEQLLELPRTEALTARTEWAWKRLAEEYAALCRPPPGSRKPVPDAVRRQVTLTSGL